MKAGTLCLTQNCAVTANNGKVVTAMHLRGQTNYQWPDGVTRPEESWWIDTMVLNIFGKPQFHVGRSQLLPLTPPDGSDGVITHDLIHDLINEH